MNKHTLSAMALTAVATLVLTSRPASAGALTYSDPSDLCEFRHDHWHAGLSRKSDAGYAHLAFLAIRRLSSRRSRPDSATSRSAKVLEPGSGQFVMATDSFEISPVSPGTIYAFGLYLGCYACDAGNPNALRRGNGHERNQLQLQRAHVEQLLGREFHNRDCERQLHDSLLRKRLD